jgi:rSAM/selenodomain-associated transferase 1
MDTTALIIFVRNPVLGKVKTRLAKDIGDDRALEIYNLLLKHTFDVTQGLTCQKFVFYADEITNNDLWEGANFSKRMQRGIDLGERMHHAMSDLFDEGFMKVIIIGSDCFEMSIPILDYAIFQLAHHDAVIGPARDGGYYLIGLNTLITELFINKAWSTNLVLRDTIDDFSRMGKSYFLLPELNDIDDSSDLDFFEKGQ